MRSATISRLILVISSLLALITGLILWPAGSASMTVHGFHSSFGIFAVGSLGVLAVVAWRAGVSRRLVAGAAAWDVVTLVFAGAHGQLLPGTWHWTLRVLHIATGLGAIAWGYYLTAAMRRRDATTELALGPSIAAAAAEFLARKRIAVTGVSRTHKAHGSNVVYQRLRQRGYQVFAVNPNAEQIDGIQCFHDLRSIPDGVDAVLIGTRPESALATMRDCADLGITHVWMHRAFGTGSVSDAATAWGRAHGIHVIDGGCPLMFEPAADPGHKVMRSLLTLTGNVPRRVS